MQFHANNDQLIQFRDKALLDASIKQHIGACSDCLAVLAELQALSEILNTSEIPQLSLQEIDKSWEVVASSLKPQRKVSAKPYWFVAAVSVVIAMIVVIQNFKIQISDQHLVETNKVTTLNNNSVPENKVTVDETQLNQLLVYSRLLENRLQSLPQPRVVRANTIDTITQLEDQISILDTRLSMQAQAPLSTQQRNLLWQQRVSSMNNLYRVRAAQLQRVSY